MNHLKSVAARIAFALVFLMAVFTAGASAQPISKFEILMNLDNNPSTGCSVPTLTGTFPGVERILRTTVDASIAQVTKIEVSSDCGGSWQDITPSGTHPVGMSNGTGGTSVIETFIPASQAPLGNPPIIRLGVLSFDNGGILRDQMLRTKEGPGPQDAPPILMQAALAIAEVPTLSEIGLLLLGLLLALAAVALLRRRSAAAVMIALLLMGLAGAAWAAVFDLNGNTTAEWTPDTLLATEPTSDAPAGTDIRALYGARTPAGLYFRIDAELLFNQPPVANDDTATVTEDSGANPINVLANDTDPESDPFTIASVTQPANGTVAITGGGTGLTYTPNANYCNNPPGTALDIFTYTLAPGGDMATVTVTVTCVDDPPVAVNDAATVAEDSAATAVNVLANDTDPDGGPESISSVTQPANGVVVITGGGTGLTYQPNANYCNSVSGPADTFTYTLTPGGSTATVSMTVTCVDDPPTAVDDAATVSEDSGANAIPVLANDTDIDGGPISITSVTQPANGAVAITGGGTGVSYTPNADYCNQPPGTTLDTFTYTLTPGGTTATVTVTVTCVDDAPVAVADSATVTEDDPATAINVLANDTDVDGGPKSIASVTQPANGAVVITGGGTGLTYQPNANYCNSVSGPADTFTYTLTPGSSSTTVTVTVTCVDDPPVAVADSATVLEDSGANAINVLANDTDVDAGPKSIASVTQPANGVVVITGGGTGLTYQPNANYCNSVSGPADTFTYTLTPGSSSTTVTVTVTCVDDPPVAVNDAATVVEDSGANAINVLANDTDIDGGPKIVASVTQPANGVVVITGGGTGLTYAPNADYCNTPPGTTPDTFTYTLAPGGSSATVTVAVTCVNDAPVIDLDANDDQGTTGSDFAITFTEGDSPKLIEDPVDATVTDVDNTTLASLTVTITNILDPGSETLTADVTGTSITANYVLATGVLTLTGPDTVANFQTVLRTVKYHDSDNDPDPTPRVIHFVANDGSTNSNTATTTVTVVSVDTAPTAVNDSATVGEDSGATAINVLANDTDPDNGPKSIASVTQPANGVVVITGGGTGLTYAPNANYCNSVSGPADTFTYTLSPGGSTATVTVTVTCVDDPPVAVADSATVAEDSGANAINVLANDTDVDGGPKSIASVTQPANGVVVITGGGTGLTYAPNANYCNSVSGPADTFTYTLTPGSSSTTVTVTVTCVDDPPVAVADAATVVEDSGANAINVLANDTDPDGGPKSIASVTQPASGVVVITGGGTGLTYAPNANYCNSVSGPADTFTYTLSPGGSSTTVTVTVTCVDDPPVAVNDAATVTEDSGANAINVLANDTDVDGGPQSIASVTQPANGVVVITGGGTGLTYAPNANYCNNPPGTTLDTFTYTLAPGSSTATVTVTVTCVNDAPVLDLDANDDKGTGGSDFAVTFTEGDPATLIEDPADATVTDVDNTTLASLTVTITNVLDPGFETLSTDVTGTSITANYVPATGVLTLTGPDTLVNFQTVLRKVRYQNTDIDPDTTPRVIHFVANDGTANSNTATSTVTVVAVDTPPTAVNDSATVTEDASATAVPVLANDTDPDGGPKSIASVTQPANGTVVITGGGTGLTYKPNANYCNSVSGPADTFTYTLTPAGPTPTATVSMTVTCVDDPPVAVNDTATVTEDDPATAINVLANDTDVDGGPKSIASVTQPANGTVVITGGGTGLTYKPNANYCNSVSGPADTFTYTLTPAGPTPTATVSVTVTCVDDPPVAVNDAATVIEDSGANAINVLANDTDIDGGPKSIQSVTQPANGVVVITGGGTGLTYAPNANYCNSVSGPADTFTYTLTPAGATPTATVSVTVTCVNDPPSDIALSNASVNENQPVNTVVGTFSTTDPDIGDTHTYTLVAGAGSTDNGSFNISGSQLRTSAVFNFEVKNSYSIRVRTTDSGGLFFEKVFTITVNDLPEAPIAGNDTYDTIGNTELRVDLAAGTTPNVAVTSPASPSNLGVLDNDTDEDIGQTNTLKVSGIVGCADTSAPFGDGPACSTANGGTVVMRDDGSFSYFPKAGDTAASDSFQYTVTDTTSLTATGTVTINRKERVWYVKNDAVAGGQGRSHDPFNTLAAAQTASSANDYIFVYFGDGTTTGQNVGITLKNGQHLIGELSGLRVTFSPAITFNGVPGTTSVQLVTQPGSTACSGGPCRPMLDNPAAGGNAVSATDVIPVEITGLNLAGNTNGIDITHTAAFAGSGSTDIRDDVVRSAGAEGIDINKGGTGALSLSLHDNTVTATGNGIDILRSNGGLTITAFANNAISGNTGGSGIVVTGPASFDSNTSNGTNDTVLGGTTVIGASGNGVGANGMVLTNVSGDLQFTDLDIYNDAGSGLVVTGTGALTTTTGTRVLVASGTSTFDSKGGPAIDINNASVSFPSLTFLRSINSTTTGLSLVNAFGGVGGTTLSVNSALNGQISDPAGASGTAVNINGGNGNITLAIPITNTSGNSVVVTGRSSDTVSFSSTISDTGSGISLTSNTGATISFTGAITASTGANPAFTATGGGTVTSTDTTSTLTTTTATALNVANTTIGASGLKFRSISAGTAASGPANGIVLNTTGALGGLVVSGTGSAGSGGTIQKTTTTGVSLTSVGGGVSLTNMNVTTGSHNGIRGTTVANLSLIGCSVTNNGTVSADNGLHITDASGTVTLTNTSVTGSFGDNVDFDSTASSAAVITNFTVTNGAFSNSANGAGIIVQLKNNAVLQTGSLTGATFNANATYAIDVVTNDNSTIGNGSGAPASGTFTISGNTITNDGGVGVSFANGGGSGAANMYVRFVNNNMTFTKSHAINVVSGAGTTGGTMKVLIDNNTIGTSGVPDSGSKLGEGIQVTQQGKTVGAVTITNNTIRALDNGAGEFGNRCIDVQTLGPTTTGQPATPFDVKITGNNVDAQYTGTFPQAAIYLGVDDQGSPTTMHAEVHGNTVPVGPGCEGNSCTASTGMIFYDKVTAPSTGTLFNFGGNGNVSTELAATNTGTAGKTCAVDLANLTLTATPVNTVP